MLFRELILIGVLLTFCFGSVLASTCGTLESGFDYSGYDLTNSTTTTSTACCAQCVARVDCYFWTWNTISHSCFLKYSSDGKSSSLLSTSGNVSPIPCQPGWYSNGGAPPCTACPAGTYAPGISIITAFYALTSNSSQQYIDCTVNMRAHVLSNRLAFQSFGSGNDAMSLTGICGDPFPGFSKVLLLTLADLPLISIASTKRVVDVTPNAVGGCTACSAGYFGSTTNLSVSSCSGQCTAGYYCAAGSISAAQTICPLGAYCPIGSATFTKCPAGTYGPLTGQTSLSQCILCPIGTARGTVGATLLSQCNACPLGRYAPSTGVALCSNCGGGSFNNVTGASACISCAEGSFQTDITQTACLLCNAGSYSNFSAATICNQCLPGQRSVSTLGSLSCTSCLAGTYSTVPSDTCVTCTPGTVVASSGATTCTACSVGTFSNTGIMCSPCAAGTFAGLPSTSVCDTCLPGSISMEGQTACSPCAAGKFTSNNIACDTCLPGSVSTQGNVVCQNCTVGFYASNNTCVACPLGTYAASQNGGGVSLVLACQTCPIGTYSFVTGATSVLLCIDNQPPTIVSSMPVFASTNVPYNISSLVLVFSEAVTMGAGADSGFAVDELSPTGALVTRILTLYYTPDTAATMVCSNGNLTLTLALPAGLLKLETRYAVVISPTLVYDFSPRSNAFAGLTHGEWQFTTQPGPIITNSSLKFDSNPGVGSTSLVLGSTKAGTVIQFRGMRLLEFGWPTVTYGPYGCNVLADSNSTTLRCAVSAGVGSNYVFVLTLGAVPSFSVKGTDTLSYPAPLIIKNSLRRNNVNYTLIPAMASSASEDIEFDGYNFGTDVTRVSLSYGPIGVIPQPYVCTVLTVSDNKVRFSTAPAGEGTHLVFRITVGGQPAIGSDYYQYPAVPHITAVYSDGCQVADTTIYNCATVGGVTLNITGLQLNAPLVVTVAQAPCTSVVLDAAGSGTWLTCRLGAGTGYNQSIVVAQNLLYSVPAFIISFAAPVITKITGCSTVLDGRVAGCIRAGGDQITIVGTSFGVDLASVFVAGHACLSVKHDIVTPHSRLTCLLPSGHGMDREVLLLQHRGEISTVSTAAYISYDSCVPGTFVSNILCVDCDHGSYSMMMNSDSCIACDAGTFANITGLSTCARCLPGSYSLKSAVNCTSCAVGQYSDSVAQSGCKPAPIGSMVSATGLASSTPCQPGYFQNIVGNDTCISCGVGTYVGTSGSASCLPCAAGTHQSLPGQSSCMACPAGSVSQYVAALQGLVGPIECTACPIGANMPSVNQAACLSCDVGYFSNETGSVLCNACQPGYFQNVAGNDKCIPCVAGTYVGTSGRASCLPCAAGTYQSLAGQSSCLVCPAGSVSKYVATLQGLVGPTTCTACHIGANMPSINQAACLSCDVGFFSNETGSVLCHPCQPGYFQNVAGNDTCIPCVAGTYVDTIGKASCLPCSAGTYQSLPGQSSCLVCPAGSVSQYFAALQGLVGPTDCTACPIGANMPSVNQAACLSCEAGSFSNITGSVICHACQPGYFQNIAGNDTCIPCVSGTYVGTSGRASCLPCAAGTYQSLPGQSSCMACPAGSVSQYLAALQGLVGPNECTACPIGTHMPSVNQAACLSCDVGFFSNETGSVLCHACQPGYYSGKGVTVCQMCDVGNYADLTGNAMCKPCSAGGYSNSAASSSCRTCAPGTYQGLSAQSLCVACVEGQYSATDGSLYCSACDSGSFTNSSSLTTCDLCLPGSYAGQKSTICLACTAGRYATRNGTGECAVCETGTYSGLGATSCIQCAVGYFSSTAEVGACLPCIPGTFARELRSTTCAQCTSGKSSPSGSSSCIDCQAGKFNPIDGSSSCSPCAAGLSSKPGSSYCSECAGGSFSQLGFTACISCAAGSFAATNMSACSGCVPGKFSGPNSVKCEACLIGSFSNVSLSTACWNCMAPMYSDVPSGATACMLCGPGSESVQRNDDGSGGFKCTVCPPGSFSSQMSSCQLCLPPLYADTAGASACVRCLAGSQAMAPLSNVTGSVKSESCKEGWFSTSNDASCQRCPSGFYSVVAATACQPCDALILTYPDQCRDAYVLTPTAFTIVTASYILGLVFTTTTIVLLWMWRADRVMFAASPRILAVMLVGLSLLQTSAYMFGVLQTPRTCAAKYWFLAMGFNLVFGSMFAKTYRLHKIFNNPGMNTVLITDSKVLLLFSPLILYDAVLLVIWQVMSPFSDILQIVGMVETTEVHMCISQHDVAFQLLIFLPKIAVMIFGVWLTYQIRNIESSFNDASHMAASVWNLIMVLSVTAILMFALQGTLRPTTLILLLIIAIVLIALFTLLVIFGPKFWKSYTQAHEKFDASAFGFSKSSVLNDSSIELPSTGLQSSSSGNGCEPERHINARITKKFHEKEAELKLLLQNLAKKNKEMGDAKTQATRVHGELQALSDEIEYRRSKTTGADAAFTIELAETGADDLCKNQFYVGGNSTL